jgi:predicted component of type VI protein secretion system
MACSIRQGRRNNAKEEAIMQYDDETYRNACDGLRQLLKQRKRSSRPTALGG